MPRKPKEEFTVMSGDKAKAKADAHVDKVKREAADRLLKSKSGFALLLVKTPRSGKTSVETVCAGAMGAEEVFQLGNALHELSHKLVQRTTEGFLEAFNAEE
jgi:hypothetical protein